MVNFQGFASAMEETAPHVINAPRMITNIPDFANFNTLYYMFLGKSMADIVRAGSDIRKRVKFSSSSKAGWYNVLNDDHEPQMGNDGTWLIAYWCAHMAQESWKDEELLVNAGGTMEGSLAEETWVQELFSKLQSLETSLMQSLAVSMWQKPDYNTMGGNDPSVPYSLPVYMNEMTNGLFNPGSVAVAGGEPVFTEIHGINPALPKYAKYKTANLTYGVGGAGFTPSNDANIIKTLSKAMRRTDFKPPPVGREYFDDPEATAIDRSGGWIAGSEDGVSRLEQLFRNSQNQWVDWMDPSGNPKFKRVPIVYEAQLNDLAVYPVSTTGLGTEATATITGPRFYGVNGKKTTMFWHKARFLEFLKLYREGPTMWTQHVASMGAMFCEDRSKNFMLSPVANH